ncbi:DNA polymerase III subunit beta [Prochlorococcus sp. MIT 1223]|uniref:DNA polymerase III subunit beta n=1 Tax=Prochlorococcus sp. MIT 1223 TaxID=3096217 RepID=UPI002A761EC8|nr:DNA polymerase III subunit beta [Prochlorococcus sp. MIT 1223]
MRLTCSQTDLNSALQLVSRAVATKPTHPILANVLLTADQSTNRLSLTGFDLSLGIQTFLTASVEISGAITLPAKLLVEIISKLSNESPVVFETDENGEMVSLKSKSGTYQVRGMPSDDFPDLPLVESGNSIKLNASEFVNSLRSTLFASSNDEAKQLLTGVNLNFKSSSFEAAATDGHRLAVFNLSNILDNDNEENFSLTLPARSLREVERFIGSCKDAESISFFSDQGQVVFMASDQIVTTRTLDGIYPNYLQLIPDEFSNELQFNRLDFIASLERVAVLADQHNNIIKLTNNNNTVLISADAQDVGSGSESIPVKTNGNIDQIAFNVRYLLEGLKVISSEEVILKCNSPTTPAIFSPVSEELKFIYLVMPVQIRS